MRSLRIILVTLLLAPTAACLVTTSETSGRSRAPGPSAPRGASLAGLVTDARTRQPIHQAAVDIITMDDHKKLTSASTGPDGTYQTNDVRPGRYIIIVRRNGYQLESHDAFALRAGTTQLNAALNPQ
jgi:carboxypeptidase family protein